MPRVVAVKRPGDSLGDRPAARTVAVETELAGEAIESVQDVALAVPELEGADDRRDREFPLADQGLRIDDVIDPKPLVGEREFAVAPIVRSFELGHSKRDVLHRFDR